MLINSDCLTALKTVGSNTLDCCVTDPPYGLSFMNKHWDYDVPTVELWQEILRVLKPGAFLLCACGTRTQHRMAVNIEDAGFEIRDIITWHYGSGFPKSMDVSKAMDKAAGAEREKTGKLTARHTSKVDNTQDSGGIMQKFVSKDWDQETGKMYETAPATDHAKQWNGWGTALKPATEFWTLARKPLSEKTVVENILKWRVGGLNIDGGRIDWDPEALKNDTLRRQSLTIDIRGGKNHAVANNPTTHVLNPESPAGRFPANVILDEFTSKIIDIQSGEAGAFAPVKKGMPGKSKGIYGDYEQKGEDGKSFRGDSGGASRFFYCAKASSNERGESNNHPTVKPLKLMRYLVRLVCPPGGTVLEPFAGSGTTCVAAMEEGFYFLAYEREEAYFKIAKARINQAVGDLI